MKKFLIGIMAIVLCLSLVSCGKSKNNNSSNENGNTNINNNTNKNTNNNSQNNNNESPSDSLPISQIGGLYNNDLPLGLETNFVKLNGTEIVIRVQTSGSSDQQANGPYYIFYNVYVGNDTLGLKCVRDAI